MGSVVKTPTAVVLLSAIGKINEKDETRKPAVVDLLFFWAVEMPSQPASGQDSGALTVPLARWEVSQDSHRARSGPKVGANQKSAVGSAVKTPTAHVVFSASGKSRKI